MRLAVLDDERAGYAQLKFDSPLSQATLAVSVRSPREGGFLGLDGRWQKSEYFFTATRIDGDAHSALFRVGPDIVNHLLDLDLVEFGAADGSFRVETIWENAIPQMPEKGAGHSFYRGAAQAPFPVRMTGAGAKPVAELEPPAEPSPEPAVASPPASVEPPPVVSLAAAVPPPVPPEVAPPPPPSFPALPSSPSPVPPRAPPPLVPPRRTGSSWLAKNALYWMPLAVVALVLGVLLSPFMHGPHEIASVVKQPDISEPDVSKPVCGMPVASLTARTAAPLSVSEECSLKPQDAFKECATCPQMVVLPASSFTMGSLSTERGRSDNEGPPHVVNFARPFAIGKFQVTRDEFAAFVNETGYETVSKCRTFERGSWVDETNLSWRNPGFPQTGTHPAVCLNWTDAKAYVAWLSKKTKRTYRLLSEAEFEYAVRGQTDLGIYSRYAFGDDEKDLCRYGNGFDQTATQKITGTSSWSYAPCNDGYAYTSPVGSFQPNVFGLYDMVGNVWQWIEDCYVGNYSATPRDGSAMTNGECSTRIIRGGSWLSVPSLLRAAYRGWINPEVRFSYGGMRVARTLNP
jgi:formylglycine-generating enzyme required for sulfatase activity